MEGSDVYPPSEDTYLLLETCLDEVESGETVLEVGTGSGLIGVRLAQEEGVSRVVATDVNPHAVSATREKALEKGVASNLDAVRTDLHASVRAEFDLVVFNPPYLPSDGGVSDDYAEKKIDGEDWMGDALDGGEGGSEVVRRFLLDARRVLSDGGRALLLLSSLTDLDGVRRTARDEGFDFERVAHESLFFEELVVLRLEPG